MLNPRVFGRAWHQPCLPAVACQLSAVPGANAIPLFCPIAPPGKKVRAGAATSCQRWQPGPIRDRHDLLFLTDCGGKRIQKVLVL